MKTIRIVILAFLVVFSACSQRGGIVFRVRDEVIHTVDPRLFGQFMERPSWGEIGPEGALVPGTNRLQPEVYELIDRMDVPILRFPGGTDVDYMDWRDMVGNIPGRSVERPVSIGHQGHSITNNFGYDEFIRFSHHTGSEPIIVVNLRDALAGEKTIEDAAQHAAGLVAYCNASAGESLPDGMPDWPAVRAENGHPKPYGVTYWQIGNETWFFFDEIEESHPDNAEEYYADCLRAFVRAMLTVDPDIEFIVDGHGRTYDAVKLVQNEFGNKIRWVNFHVYTPWGIKEVLKDGGTVPVETLSASDIWNAWVAVPAFDSDGLSVLSHPLIDEARQDGIKLSVTEWNWNGWWNTQPAALNSFMSKGVGAAGILHALMRSADVIELGCQSMLVGNSWGIHAVWADREAEIPPRYMPTGQVTMMYSQHHGPKRLKLESNGIQTYAQPYRMAGIRPCENVAYLDALATASDNTIFFHIINRHFDQAAEITVDLSDFGTLAGAAHHYILDGRLENEPSAGEPRQIAEISHTDIHYDGSTINILLPERSVSCIEIPLTRQ
jgi:alpha-L-arabinofuranosidase